MGRRHHVEVLRPGCGIVVERQRPEAVDEDDRPPHAAAKQRDEAVVLDVATVGEHLAARHRGLSVAATHRPDVSVGIASRVAVGCGKRTARSDHVGKREDPIGLPDIDDAAELVTSWRTAAKREGLHKATADPNPIRSRPKRVRRRCPDAKWCVFEPDTLGWPVVGCVRRPVQGRVDQQIRTMRPAPRRMQRRISEVRVPLIDLPGRIVVEGEASRMSRIIETERLEKHLPDCVGPDPIRCDAAAALRDNDRTTEVTCGRVTQLVRFDDVECGSRHALWLLVSPQQLYVAAGGTGIVGVGRRRPRATGYRGDIPDPRDQSAFRQASEMPDRRCVGPRAAPREAHTGEGRRRDRRVRPFRIEGAGPISGPNACGAWLCHVRTVSANVRVGRGTPT